MYTGNNLDVYDKGKLILMSQVRQLSLVTSLLLAHHIPLNFFSKVFGHYLSFFVNKVIPMPFYSTLQLEPKITARSL